MAVYKVPQDVEADDKLIGPFSFRQFIYLLIVAGAGFIGWFLGQLFLPLIILVLPIIIFFGALALPLRKDQPMETYLAALVSFYLKPHRRLWDPDGMQMLVEITVPKVVEVQRTKDISEEEAEQRLSYLANIVDSRGWAVRGVQGQGPVSPGSMTSDAYFEAQSTPDMLDETVGVGQEFNQRLDQADAKRHQDMINSVRNQSAAVTAAVVPPPSGVVQPVMPALPVPDPYSAIPAPVPVPVTTVSTTQVAPDDTNTHVSYAPYPSMNQSVINPIGTAPPNPDPAQPIAKPSEKPLSPDIINLANNPDLSVETIAREANRIHEREKLSEDEVVISLR
jgi:hypothetical protein